MTEASNPNKGVPPGGEKRQPVELQETLLLTDVPDVSAMISDPHPPPSATATLSTAALAALSQRYEILAEAGHGSMGNVYKARDRETGEIVALKLLKPEIASDQSMMERFKNELLFARKITHKNVCRLHEFNRLGGIAYTSMEFVEGESLRSVLNRFGGLPARKALDLVGQICSGLKEAHTQGIVHRDLKPENVMIDGQGNVKIMDFGIARSMEAVTRMTGSMVGTPAYMAPEQVGGKPVDYRTDIYSLGLIMYEVFTGAPAFQADNAVAVALKQMRESPAPPHEIEPTIPAVVERAILKCLEKEPPRRFQSIGELETALRAPAVAGAPAFMPVPSVPAVPAYPRHSPMPSQLFHPPQAPEPKSAPAVAWVLLGAMMVVGGFAGWRAFQVVQAAENVPPPDRLPAPLPPDFALDGSLAQANNSRVPVPASVPDTTDTTASDAAPTDSKPAEPAPVLHASEQASAPLQTAPAKQSLAPDAAPNPAQPRAKKGFGETEPVAAPPVNDSTPSYLWMGRFEREDKAQSTAKKIEDLGLPVSVVPRHGLAGEFYVVLTGPYGPERIESAMDYLKTQGFMEVRVVKNPFGNQRPGQPQSQGQSQGQGQSPN
jgi:Protein kinase domain